MNPAFVINFYRHDADLAIALLHQIRALYPEAWIGAIADGHAPLCFGSLCQNLRVEYLKGDRLKLPQFGGAWISRYLNFGWGEGDPLIKLDPDAWLYRRFTYFCRADIAGTQICFLPQRLHMIRGGCVAYRQSAIDRILNSGVLDDRCYTNPEYYAYRRFEEFAKQGEGRSAELIAGEDCIMGHVAKRLSLLQGNWDEVRVCFREPVPQNLDLQWAVTHPRQYPPKQTTG